MRSAHRHIAGERLLVAALTVYLVLLWLETIGFAPRVPRRVEPSDLVLVATVPLGLPLVFSDRRRHLRSLVVIATAAIAATVAVRALATGAFPLRTAARHLLELWLVVVFASATASAGFARLARAFVGVSAAFAAAAFCGGLLGAAGLLHGVERLAFRPAFVLRLPHPTLGSFPRFVGGFGYSPERCGEWAASAAAVLAVAWRCRRGRRRWPLGAAALAAIATGLMTLSIAAASAVAAWPVWLARGGAGRRAVTGAAAVAVAAIALVQIPVHLGRLGRGATTATPCEQEFPNYWARWAAPVPPGGRATWARAADAAADRCQLWSAGDRHILTRYAVAKYEAASLWLGAPLLGVGERGFRHRARGETRADGWRYWNPYLGPHGLIHGVAAEQGLLGLALYGLLAVGLVRALRRAGPDRRAAATAVALLLAAFAVTGIDIDIEKLRLFWIAVGVAAGLGFGDGDRPPRPPAPTPTPTLVPETGLTSTQSVVP